MRAMNATAEMEREIADVCAELHAIPTRLEAIPPNVRHEVAAEIVALLARTLVSVNLLLRPPPSNRQNT
jgi:hypothetical protein